MELIRTDTDYAMRMLVHMAREGGERPLGARVLAEAQAIPEAFAYKILQRLTRACLTERYMGPAGGFKLARDPEQITLLQVAEAVQGTVAVRDCVLGEDACPRRPSCSISARLDKLQREMLDLLADMTLAEVLATAPVGNGGTHSGRSSASRVSKTTRKGVIR
ncbi:MAG: Rrf2 family transcriptional regulator [Chloroflexi bacterium]|nr:Rrf2 family transcriptional regulator [Chloroflexota bacterium]